MNQPEPDFEKLLNNLKGNNKCPKNRKKKFSLVDVVDRFVKENPSESKNM